MEIPSYYDLMMASQQPPQKDRGTSKVAPAPKLNRFKKGDAILVTDEFGKEFGATYESRNGSNRSMIRINNERTSVSTESIRLKL